MRGTDFADGFKQVTSLVNNPFAQAGLQHASSMLGEKLKIDGMMGKVFNPQIREYFNVDTTTVKNKLMKILFPFKEYDFEQQIKKLDLYIPIVSFMTLIMFSTIVKGILSEDFEPNLFRKTIWILIFTFAEVLLAKGTQNSISSLNIGTLELCSLVSYRFVSLSVVVVVLVITNMSIPYLHFIGIIYVFLVDTYYVKIELSNYAKQKFTQEGLGSKIALLVHIVVTLAIIWLSDLI